MNYYFGRTIRKMLKDFCPFYSSVKVDLTSSSYIIQSFDAFKIYGNIYKHRP